MKEVRNHTRDMATDKVSQSVFLFGMARSGTFILGKILHSFKNIECTFEPPILLSLFSLLNRIDENSWRLLFETHLFEDFYMNALAGRSINCNVKDDSSIFVAKEKRDVELRLNSSFGDGQLLEMSKNGRIACKLGFLSNDLQTLQAWYPKIKIINSVREAEDVIASFIAKNWYSDETLQADEVVMPHIKKGKFRIPFWIPSKDHDLWIDYNQVERIAYDYIYISKQIENCNSDVIWYSDLVKNPREIVKKMSESIGEVWGSKTEDLVNSIQRRTPRTSSTILETVSHELRSELKYWNEFNQERGTKFLNQN